MLNNDIKEILDNIKDIVNDYIKKCNYKENDIIYDEVNFSVKQWKLLLDYITNLQEKNKGINYHINKEKLFGTIHELQKSYEKLERTKKNGDED